MGSGSFTKSSFDAYASTRGLKVDSYGKIDYGDRSAQDVFVKRQLDPSMDIKGKVRECRDSEEHPSTVPVIVGIDVTGSMGPAAMEVASQMGNIMTELFEKVKDVEFMVMGIGDLAYDRYPIQVSQFESDIRVSEHLDKICFEGGGGGNDFESYTAAWYVGAKCTELDCWKRGAKGLIITIGDEKLNPYLPFKSLNNITGRSEQDNIETVKLLDEVLPKYALAHIHVTHDGGSRDRAKDVRKACDQYGVRCTLINGVANLADTITKLVVEHAGVQSSVGSFLAEDNTGSAAESPAREGEVSW